MPSAHLPNGLIYKNSLLENEEIKCKIHDLIQKGHIQPSSSPCGRPIVLVQKKDGTWQINTGYIILNKITIKNRYPIPQIDNLIDQLKGTKLFSNIDLQLGYHQVPIEQTNVWKATFKSKQGLFELLVVPFGLTNAPTTFTRMMDDILLSFTDYFVVI
jgi:hypothetical protein